MKKQNLIFNLLLILLCFTACQTESGVEEESAELTDWDTKEMYSTHVQDTFAISIQYPKEYHQDSLGKYPMLLLSDADLYFPVLAPILHQYESVGILPPMVLVGLGYGSIARMDSLRNRDYLYPAGLPSDEMETPGGGENFYQFITQELIPELQQNGITNAHRVLMGHSFGGYFALYACLRQAELQRQDFAAYVTASPSLWYHDFYLEKKFGEGNILGEQDIFLSIGGQEGADWGLKPFDQLLQVLEPHAAGKNVHSQVYAGLGHMDVAMVSFLQGISMLANQTK